MASKKDTEIDYRFYVPDNIVDIRKTTPDDDYDYSVIVDPTNPEAYPQPSLNYEKLPTPQVDIKIVQQTPTFAPDGSVRIDVVIELPDQPQNVEYEPQITKAV